MIRYRLITREEGIELVKRHDHNLDPKAVKDFMAFAGYTATEFWGIVNKFYNREIFELNEFGEWKLKVPVWEAGTYDRTR